MTAAWSRIAKHELAEDAWTYLDDNSADGCAYHNNEHVYSMYAYLAKTGETYDEALDWAVLFHDIVYDANPDKELRSAQFWDERASDYEELGHIRDRVFFLIMATKEHLVDGTDPQVSAIVRADLHGLTNTVTTHFNFSKIMRESIALYGITPQDFAVASHDFMRDLYHRVDANKQSDPTHAAFYDLVLRGVSASMVLSNLIVGY